MKLSCCCIQRTDMFQELAVIVAVLLVTVLPQSLCVEFNSSIFPIVSPYIALDIN